MTEPQKATSVWQDASKKTLTQPSEFVKSEFENGDTQATYSPSLSAIDEEYLAAINSGDMESAQLMVDEAAKAAGYPERGYHGSKKAAEHNGTTRRIVS